MDFSYSEEQVMLQDSIAKFVAQDYDFAKRRLILESDTGFKQEHWNTFAELGWLMMPFSESDGGLSGSAVDLMLIMQELGKGIVVEPFLITAILCGGLISDAGNEAQKSELLPAIMDGSLQLAFAFTEKQSRYCLSDITTTASKDNDGYILNGNKSVVLNAPAANKLIVSARTTGEQRDEEGISLFIVDTSTPGIKLNAFTTVDGHQAAEIEFVNVKVTQENLLGELGQSFTAISKNIDRATLALCAEAVGAMEVSYKKTVQYTIDRKQFGVSISNFQALQHRMVEMFMEYEQARSILMMACMQLDSNDGHAPKAVSAAKSRIGKAARLIGQESVQLHGGIGVTEEYEIGHYFKRLTTFQFLFGSTDYHTQRFANL